MASKKKIRTKLKVAVRLETQKLMSENKPMMAAAEKIVKNQSKNADQPSKPAKGKSIVEIISLSPDEIKSFNSFLESVKNHIVNEPNSALSKLRKRLRALGISGIEEFLQEIDLIKFLTTDHDPKGRIFEVLVLKDKMMRLFIKYLAGESWKNMIQQKAKIKNIKGEILDAAKFEDIDFEIATDFKTHPDNQLFHDFGSVRYNPKTGELFLISGEIKEPAAARGLPEQFAKRENRISQSEALESKQISFVLNGRRIPVDSEKVFLLKDDAVGIARLRKDSKIEKASDINFNSEILEITESRPMVTKAENPELFFIWQVKTKDFTPDEIVKELQMLKKMMKFKK